MMIFLALFFVFSGSVFAQSEFNPEIDSSQATAPEPVQTKNSSSGATNGIFGDVDLNNFLTDKTYGNDFFDRDGLLIQMATGFANWLLRLIGTVCVIMIIFGGYQYLFGAIEGKGEGKQTVIYALTGLTVAIFAVVIVSLTMGLVGGVVPPAPEVSKTETPKAPPGKRVGGNILSPEGAGPKETILRNAGWEIYASGLCRKEDKKGCTYAEGLKENVVNSLVTIAREYPGAKAFTGGAETGDHKDGSAHHDGLAADFGIDPKLF